MAVFPLLLTRTSGCTNSRIVSDTKTPIWPHCIPIYVSPHLDYANENIASHIVILPEFGIIDEVQGGNGQYPKNKEINADVLHDIE